MKHVSVMAVLLAVSLGAHAQNIQLHYDFGKKIYSNEESGRQDVTLTYETYRSDKLGSWFYWIDVDIDKHGDLGAYTEVSREFNIGKKGFAAHVEYNGGLNRHGSFQTAGLLGVAWNGHNEDFSTTYSVQALYKQYFSQNGLGGYASLQLTGVWSTSFGSENKWTSSGFFDFWRGEKSNGHGQLVFITEPQLWYNVSPSFSVGTELEISNNFIYNTYNGKTFFVNPTLAIKFNL